MDLALGRFSEGSIKILLCELNGLRAAGYQYQFASCCPQYLRRITLSLCGLNMWVRTIDLRSKVLFFCLYITRSKREGMMIALNEGK
jgi:hypothetical protein